MEQQGTSKKAVLDEAGFQQLLSAAFLLQQHNDRLISSTPKKDSVVDPAQSLSEIVETQNRIHSDELNFDDSVALIAERVRKITGVEGVAIGVVERDQLKYRAGVGTAAGAFGSSLPQRNSLSAECLRTGQLFLSPDAIRDARVPQELAQKRQTRAFVSLPVYYEQKVAGVLELCAAQPRRFEEKELRLCQLMAGLITECVAKATEAEWKQALAAERATMLEALEKIKPHLQKMANGTADLEKESPLPSTPSMPVSSAIRSDRADQARAKDAKISPQVCRGCGNPLDEHQLFCGICGTECRTDAAKDSANDWASMWNPLSQDRQRVAEEKSAHEESLPSPEELSQDEDLPLALREIIAKFSDEEERPARALEAVAPPEIVEDIDDELPSYPQEATKAPELAEIPHEKSEPVVLDQEVEPEPDLRIVEVPESRAIQPAPWHSARGTKAWLEALGAKHPSRQWMSQNWQAYRGTIYLSLAAALLIAVFVGSSPVTTNGSGRRGLQKPRLTLMETILVNLGLAEMPQPVTVPHPGNPQTQVWIDVHTAMYYCPGADLYGKTPGGRVVSQYDAQQDQYEPAFRRACD